MFETYDNIDIWDKNNYDYPPGEKLGLDWKYERDRRITACRNSVRNMDDEAELQRIASEHPLEWLRFDAIKTMRDQVKLLEFLHSDAYREREAALYGIQDQEILATYIFKPRSKRESKRPEYRREFDEAIAALTNYTDEQGLIKLALTDYEGAIRRIADEKLTDRTAYFRHPLDLHDPLKDRESEALARALREITDEEFRFRIAKMHPSWQIRLQAAWIFDYKDERRIEIARTDPDWRVRDELVWYILDSDSDILAEIANTDPDERVRATAERALTTDRWYYYDDPDSEPW